MAPNEAMISFSHCSFLSALFLFFQLQHRQSPRSAQQALSLACQGGERFLSASLAPLASIVRYLVSVPPPESAGKVSLE